MRLYLKKQPKKQVLGVKCVRIFGKITNAKEKLQWFPESMEEKAQSEWTSGLSDCIVNLLLTKEHVMKKDRNVR